MRPFRAAVFGATILACWNPSVAQTPPTATEEFNLRIKCKQMADEKAESMMERPMTAAEGASMGLKPADVAAMNRLTEQRLANVIMSSHSSNYDAKQNRCYIEIVDHRRAGRNFEIDVQVRGVYDGQTDDMLSFAKIENGKKVGMVFDPEHTSTMGTNLGWDDANSYMDEKMRAKRN
jgi:hypothetical protein